ncbi:MAG: lysophospholipid acyltransferase family protein [Thermoanaerobaculum sp.]|nr:lysophospholipid acyltransferase family protein [Thermoanaerobaculum sp.]
MGEGGAYRAGLLLGLSLRAYRRLLRWRVGGWVPLPRPCVLAVWHGRLLGVLLAQTGSGMVTMASRSSDGALAAGAVRALGCQAVRGSASRGGAQALRALKRALERGAPLAGLTVDGPRGPWRVVKPGVVAAARWLGAPIVPATFSATRVKVLGSWDRMVIPKPGSRVHVHFGEPLDPASLPPSVDAACQVVGEALDTLTLQLDQEVLGHPLWGEGKP